MTPRSPARVQGLRELLHTRFTITRRIQPCSNFIAGKQYLYRFQLSGLDKSNLGKDQQVDGGLRVEGIRII